MAGSLVMGVLTGLLSRRLFGQAWVNAFVGTGFLGGFTTFSSFALDTVRLWQEGQFFFAAGNILLNTIGCMLLAGLGWMLTYRSEH
jgi:CrcB protein